MAEVLAPFNQATSSFHTRPSSSETFQSSNSHQQGNNHGPRLVQMNRNNYNPHGASGYRGTSTAPTYAFKATPTLNSNSAHNRTASPPSTSQPQRPQQAQEDKSGLNRQRYPGTPSVSTTSNSSTSSTGPTWSQQLFSKDDSTLSSNFEVAPFTTNLPAANKVENAPEAKPLAVAADAPVKPSPARYQRNHRGSEASSDSAHASVSNVQQNGTAVPKMGQFQYIPHFASKGNQPPSLSTKGSNTSLSERSASTERAATTSGAEVRDSQPTSPASQTPPATNSMNRYRKRGSLGGNIEVSDKGSDKSPTAAGSDLRSSDGPPALHPRPSSRQDGRPASASGSGSGSGPPKPFGVSGPARSFAEVARRTNNPSPLSRPLSPENTSKDPPGSPPSPPGPTSRDRAFQSPAVAAMAALNDKDGQKGVKSRIRRAFSFGSSAELRRATGEVDASTAADRAKARQEQFRDELDEEQNMIAQQQEAAGLGNNIYSGQAGFTGSTDNLSISSTASSASLMLRKMGKGMKKGGRSIKGLFRPKSAIGVPPPDEPLQPSVGQVSMVTVEAEREKVNVNADPRDQNGGGTGFPRLEKNSMDVTRGSGSLRDMHGPGLENGFKDTRKSIVGGDQDRQEVLNSVRRGILKRTGTSSPVVSPSVKSAENPFTHENQSFERRGSPTPSNASSEPRRKDGHRRTDSTALDGNQGYFDVPRLTSPSSRSLPGTPKSVSRNISFNTRIQFHDVWSATDYDRRGDIATCNRLTPMLAQQIKEELNTFKMEMEVHEMSKPHTHFF